MSYTRTFHKTVTVHYSRTVSYPASQNGGTITVSGSASEDVAVNIHVNTTPFDSQVAACNTSVNTLTGAIAATEVAQVASLRSNANKVGKAIVDGFFKTVRSEISQQISALKSEVDATISHLRELAKRCADKRRQMQVDYDRITARYTKTFNDLNRELENRIYMLDKHAFDLRRHTERYTLPMLGSELVGEAAVTSQEQAQAAALMSGARSKSLAEDTIMWIDEYLQEQAKTDALLQHCTVPSAGNPVKYAPIIHIQRIGPDKSILRDTYVPAPLLEKAHYDADNNSYYHTWSKVSDDTIASINQHFEEKLSDSSNGASAHDNRVREMARRLFSADAERGFYSQV